MKIFLSPYRLKLKKRGEARKGYLLKLETDEFKAGYADIFPWAQFGDPSFQDIPKLLKEKNLPPLLQKSLFFAKKDGLARSQNISLLKSKELKNHYLVTDALSFSAESMRSALAQGFARFKFKVCLNPEKEVPHLIQLAKDLPEKALFRLDCNTRGDKAFLKALEEIKNKIEFIEDPTNELEFWKTDWPFAYDQPEVSLSDVDVSWQVIKPAKQGLPQLNDKKYVFTSYMDHPLGIAHAFCESFAFGPQEVDYGLMSQNIYEETNFHEGLICKGPHLSFVEGLGIGFDQILEGQDWTSL